MFPGLCNGAPTQNYARAAGAKALCHSPSLAHGGRWSRDFQMGMQRLERGVRAVYGLYVRGRSEPERGPERDGAGRELHDANGGKREEAF